MDTPSEIQASMCFMCKEAGPRGCLECRFQSMARDIRTALYEKMGADQHAAEWEERGTDLEAKLSAHIKNAKEWQAESMEYAKDNAALRQRVIELERQLTVRIDMINELRAAK